MAFALLVVRTPHSLVMNEGGGGGEIRIKTDLIKMMVLVILFANNHTFTVF